MRPVALVGQSFRSIFANKARSSLTVLGIVIGIASVIALVSLGNGLKASVSGQIGNLGTKDLSIGSQDPTRETATRQAGRGGGPGGFSFGGGNVSTLTVTDYSMIKNNPDISMATVDVNSRLDVALTSDATTATAYQVHGIDADYFALNSLTASKGALLTQSQIDTTVPQVVLGSSAATGIFPGVTNVIGQSVYIKGVLFTVAGVLKDQTNASPFNNPSNSIYMGYKSYLSATATTTFGTVTARAKSEDVVTDAKNVILATLLKNHQITDSTKADVAIQTSADLLATRNNIADSFTTTLAGVAAISLLVGGIGIMNIMLVTVTERTREIGLRRAIGAKNRHILIQFLAESLLLTLIGGGLGVLAGIIASHQSSSLLNFLPQRGPNAGSTSIQAIVHPETLIMAVAISAGIGIVFGLFPAWKASRLDPVEALRFE